ncbi:MAG: hypothetical protein EXX96DRAFT_608953 [Benjaminiella poitrasii]|nr:MAG: hypothetical protein EXX96DRAFT_608953 [Benjaminiella poitrasii]
MQHMDYMNILVLNLVSNYINVFIFLCIQLIDYKKPSSKKTITNKSNQQIWKKANQFATPIIIHTNNDLGHTEYKPKLVILKRPEEEKIKQKLKTEKMAAERPVKALEDKVKDYEEAKRKIFEKFEDIEHNKTKNQ